jgi:hypothetical protein
MKFKEGHYENARKLSLLAAVQRLGHLRLRHPGDAVTQSATAMTFDQALETLIAISIAQLAASGRSDNRRLQEALRIATNYLELAPTPPAIGSRELEVLQAWMATRPTGRADQ